MADKFNVQGEAFHHLTRVYDNLKKKGMANITSGMIQSRLTMLDNLWQQFTAQHAKLMETRTAEQEKHEYFTKDCYSIAEESFMDQQAQLLDLRERIIGTQPHASNTTQPLGHAEGSELRQRALLPRINLPTFDGKYSDWTPFHDLFVSLVIQDTSLKNVDRFHYLRGCLTGEAAGLIRNIKTTESNFKRAWTALQERFQNKRRLVRAQLASLGALQPAKKESSSELKRIYYATWDVVDALADMGRPDPTDWIVYLTVERLDLQSQREWDIELGSSTETPTLDQLKKFIDARIHSVEALEERRGEKRVEESTEKRSSGKPAQVHQVATRKESTKTCGLCTGAHYLLFCPRYQEKSQPSRRDALTSLQRCLNCLGKHKVVDCPSNKRCQKCSEKHHTSIHETFDETHEATVNHVAPFLSGSPRTVILGAARVRAYTPAGQYAVVRALIDPGSEVSLISDRLVKQLGLKRQRARIPLAFAGGVRSLCTRGLVWLDVTADQAKKLTVRVPAFALANLSSYKPRALPDLARWSHLHGLQWADPLQANQDPVELLLGADVYNDILMDGVRKGPPDSPLAQETVFGWILTGGIKGLHALAQDQRSPTVQFCSTHADLTRVLERFWEQEEVRVTPTLSLDDQACEEHFLTTHRRTSEGRFVVRLPFKSSPELGVSRTAALRTLGSMQRRFSKDAEFHKAYTEFMKEYEDLGHMQTTRRSPSGTGYYLPHHGVLREASTTTKLRVVFNGSMPTSSGKSLNDFFHIGNNLLPALTDVLLRWRRHRIAFVADVEKMYRQIVVHPDDRDFQRILWTKGSGKKTTEYQLCTVTYGLACAPYLALRCLQQLAKDEAIRYPAGSQTLLLDVYMDDILSGAPTLEEAQLLQRELNLLCKAGGFRLRKWASNSQDFLQPIASADLGATRQWDTDTTHGVLGIQWLPESDRFQIRCLQGCSSAKVTKRNVLSSAAQIFDPAGWLAPVTVRAKIFIQSLWLLKTDWDEPLAPTEESLWRDFINALPALRDIQIPRWLGLTTSQQHLQVHGFSDASERAFSAVVYLQVVEDNGLGQLSLITAKTKVAPLKRVSIPRLELCGAQLLTRLTARTLETLGLTVDAVHLWTDSLVTLGWIQSHSSRWQTYVANRVADIQRTLPTAQWHHVRGQDNPADCASRGLSPSELPNHQLWWNGPEWLASTTHWGAEAVPAPDLDLEEQRQALHIQAAPESEVSLHLARFSNYRHLLRVTAWCCRWLPKHRGTRTPYLRGHELQEAQRRLVRLVQHQFFTQEVACLAAKRPLPSKSRLLRLNPFLDTTEDLDGILRVGGRLQHSLLTFSRKHPIILPDESHLAALYIDEAHRRCLHGGIQLTLSTLRQRCWILRGRPMVKAFIHRCPTCVRWKGNSMSQLMGNLPAVRVTPSRPFSRVGIDYAGPILLRTSKGRGQHAYKGYIALFVCLATKAVHLEVVSDGTTDAFLAALRRFISRRGRCSHILSDCGTTFVGADRELRALLQVVNSTRLLDAVASEGIEWIFNPPAAPHFGGIWEAAVKSVKHHLRRVIGEHKLTYEEMATLLVEIEACLNSRPLQPLSDDPEDLHALTPSHFLIGEALTALPEPNLEELPVNRLSRWQLVQKMQQHFWRVWARDYLNTLQTRGKWTRAQGSIKSGDLCLIRNELQPPSRWPLARVLQVHPGTDGHVRVVTLKTATSEFTRPIHKVILLPNNDATGTDPGRIANNNNSRDLRSDSLVNA